MFQSLINKMDEAMQSSLVSAQTKQWLAYVKGALLQSDTLAAADKQFRELVNAAQQLNDQTIRLASRIDKIESVVKELQIKNNTENRIDTSPLVLHDADNTSTT